MYAAELLRRVALRIDADERHLEVGNSPPASARSRAAPASVGQTSGQCVNPKNTSVGWPRSAAGWCGRAVRVHQAEVRQRARRAATKCPIPAKARRAGSACARHTRRRRPQPRRARRPKSSSDSTWRDYFTGTVGIPQANCIASVQRRLRRARVYFGHGTDNAATKRPRWCITCCDLSHDAPPRVLQRRVTAAQRERCRGAAATAHRRARAAGLSHSRSVVRRTARSTSTNAC